jgi:hypothetical protein
MKYRFLPYSRRGAGASIVTGTADTTGRPKAALELHAELQETGGAMRGADHTQDYTVLGPGDVTGIDPSQVILVSPRADTHNMEPNYLVHIEFAHPDLPWMFTPQGPDGARLKPWIVLVVLEEPRGERRVTTRAGSRNPVLEVNAADLPNLDDSWAWAHVQTIDEGISHDAILGNWESNRGLVLSRLLSPRRLEENKDYVACVVPAFASGAQAGLGQGPSRGAEPAWDRNAGTVTLPVYYHWRFSTGPSGDFETLAQKLRGARPEEIADVGQRSVYLDAQLSRLQEPGQAPFFEPRLLQVRTAIAHDALTPGPLSPLPSAPVDEPARTELGKRLKFLIDFQERSRRSGSDDIIVGPPIYGQWHAERLSVDDVIDTPEVIMPGSTSWVAELNADVELRTAAAAGTRVVQKEQEDLMARAWEQLQAVAEANRRARWGLLYQSATRLLHQNRVQQRPLGTLLRLTAPALGRLPVDAVTSIAASIQTTSLPMTVVGANFSRATRFARRTAAQPVATAMLDSAVPKMLASNFDAASRARLTSVETRLRPSELGGLLRSAGIADQISVSTGLSLDDQVQRLENLPDIIRVTAQQVTPAPPPQEDVPVRPRSRRRIDPSIYVQVEPQVETAGRMRDIARTLRDTGFAAQNDHVNIEIEHLAVQEGNQAVGISPDMLAVLNANDLLAANRHGEGLLVDAVQSTNYNVSAVQLQELNTVLGPQMTTEAATSFTRLASVRSATMAQFHVDEPVSPFATAGISAELIGAYVAATEGIQERVTGATRIDLPVREALDPALTHSIVVSRTEPAVQYRKMLEWALPILITGPRKPRRRTPSHQIMAAPEFRDPLVERLKRFDPEWVLGHADKLPPNSISILAANARFVESVLVGANYEMARELLWRRYPTDLMGTCFARFWPLPPSAPDDIHPIAMWDANLGFNAADNDANPGQDVVVVVRGDLLRRYPNTIISAVKGRVEQAGDGATFVPQQGVGPARELFRGKLDPDITYAGLAIDLATLRDTSGAPNFWFIALTQPADEPRFGLDDEVDSAGRRLPPSPRVVGTLNQLSWQSLPLEAVEAGQLRAGVAIPGNWGVQAGETSVKWGPDSDGGQVGSILLQLPFQLLLKASDYV